MINRLLEIDSQVFLFLNNLGTELYDDFWRLLSNQICTFFVVLLIVLFCLVIQKRSRPISLLFSLFRDRCFFIYSYFVDLGHGQNRGYHDNPDEKGVILVQAQIHLRHLMIWVGCPKNLRNYRQNLDKSLILSFCIPLLGARFLDGVSWTSALTVLLYQILQWSLRDFEYLTTPGAMYKPLWKHGVVRLRMTTLLFLYHPPR